MIGVFLKCSSSVLKFIYFKVFNYEYMSVRTLRLCAEARQSLRHHTAWSGSDQWLWLLGPELGSSKEQIVLSVVLGAKRTTKVMAGVFSSM